MQTPAYAHSGTQGRLILFIANAFSVELGILKWNKGARLCGWWSQEQALFVNRAPCCSAELSWGESTALCLAPSALLALEGSCGSSKRASQLLGRKAAPRESGASQHFPWAQSGGTGNSPTLPIGADSPFSTYSSTSLIPVHLPLQLRTPPKKGP